jgi:hypothetical protein
MGGEYGSRGLHSIPVAQREREKRKERKREKETEKSGL